jgi:hypothetical protein
VLFQGNLLLLPSNLSVWWASLAFNNYCQRRKEDH